MKLYDKHFYSMDVDPGSCVNFFTILLTILRHQSIQLLFTRKKLWSDLYIYLNVDPVTLSPFIPRRFSACIYYIIDVLFIKLYI